MVLEVLRCKCLDWTGQLIEKGFFPTVPNAYTAISFDLLEQYNCIATSGSLSKQGFASGMEEFHRGKLGRESYRYSEVFRNCIPFWLRTRLKRDEVVNNALNKFLDGKETISIDTTARAIESGASIDADGDSSMQELDIESAQVRNAITPDGLDSGDSGSSNAPKHIRKPFRFGINNFPTLCPCCFHRTENDEGSPACCSLDGNMQQSRYGHVAPDNFDRYDEWTFIHAPEHEREEIEKLKLPAGEAVCDHNFTAGNGNPKPTTLRMFDETGLLLMVCRFVSQQPHLNYYLANLDVFVTAQT